MSPDVLLFAVIWVILIILFVQGGMVGWARYKFGIKAPATTGNETFERYFRAHMNMVENTLFFLPMMVLFAITVNTYWAAVAGAVWAVGRILYAIGYHRDASKRYFGATLYTPALIVVTFGSAYGIMRAFFGGL